MLIWIAVWLTAENEVVVPFTGINAESDAKKFVESQANAEDYMIWRTMANNPDYTPSIFQWKATEPE